MPFPTPDRFDEPDEYLRIEFIQAVADLISDVVRTGTDLHGHKLFEDELLPYMRDAMDSLHDRIQALEWAIVDVSDQDILKHGLHGEQLRFKLAAIDLRDRHYRLIGGVTNFRWLLETLEGLLDSIIDATAAGGAIKAFKAALINSTRSEFSMES